MQEQLLKAVKKHIESDLSEVGIDLSLEPLLLSRSNTHFVFSCTNQEKDFKISVNFIELPPAKDNGDNKYESIFRLSFELPDDIFSKNWERAICEQLVSLISDEWIEIPEGKTYSREGMQARVLLEREEKAKHAKYRIKFNDNPYGNHRLTNEKGVQYTIFFRDLPNERGYCSCKDYQANKIGTCKHLLFAFAHKKGKKKNLRVPKKSYPFAEVAVDPFDPKKVRLYHPNIAQLSHQTQNLIAKYFKDGVYLENTNEALRQLLHFQLQADSIEEICFRPEVSKLIEQAYNDHLLAVLAKKEKIDWETITNATLSPYQRQGIEFLTFRQGAILADEMGLGKTLQGISAAMAKKTIFNFSRCLIICPASLKSQWKKEIEKFTDQSATIIAGSIEERTLQYQNADTYFVVINYEQVLRDQEIINTSDIDLIILDEAQKIKNYESKTARAVKRLKKRHALVLTGTPIENRLVDLFSIIDFVNSGFLGPLWEFAYQHCFFDEHKRDKITGYFGLQTLKNKLSSILIRRTKEEVIKELPNLREINIPLKITTLQADYHASYARIVSQIIRKKFLTQYDFNRLMMALNSMRMVCNHSALVDELTNDSPKLDELKELLVDKIMVTERSRKIIIFSEWVKMNAFIGEMLGDIGVEYVELNGSVPVMKRQALVDHFREDENCKVFLSTEAGGSGLNLQVADTVINFELPWNPAKKNQRMGRINRIGQTAKKLQVVNLLTIGTIEENIAAGLAVKQNLFDNVLNQDDDLDIVDFSSKGRAQFLKSLETMIHEIQETDPLEVAFESEEKERLNDFFDEENEEVPVFKNPQNAQSIKETKEVMNKGLEFLSGMYKMATGKELNFSEDSISIDENTGELVMKFKLPKTN